MSGCFLLAMFIFASGLARTGLELIIFRAFQGIAVSMCFPTSFSILTNSFPNGKRRNIAFSCLGLSQPFGWSVGLFLGGFFEGRPLGWRFGFYLSSGATMLLLIVNYFSLPQDRQRGPITWSRMVHEIDWVGALISSVCLGVLSYVFS
jgi:MFS family permease